jgi:DNA (cytosine-5)-methyltransferase 1
VVQPLEESLPTVTAHASQHYICAYYSAGDQVVSVNEPMPTVTTKDRLALVDGKVDVNDCGMRMLSPEELKLGMGFKPEYVIKGTAKERVKQAGNAVTPPAMAMIMERVGRMFD